MGRSLEGAQEIVIRGARQNNLKGIDVRIPLGKLTVVTGVSGSGKSSLAFDTIYSEGQRRYVETFSPYTRQFLDRMDKPQVDSVEGIPPAIAIDQVNPVRTSRSTVGTMTELNDHLKLLYARAARLFCSGCGKEVRRDSPETIVEALFEAARGARAIVTFPLAIPERFSDEEIADLLARQGYQRLYERVGNRLDVVQDRVVLDEGHRARIVDDLETALKFGQGRVDVHLADSERALRFSSDLHCPDCDIHYRDPLPNLFSFNSPIGACDTCHGFGRIIGIDYHLVVPDESKSLAEGAVRPWQTKSFHECQDDLMKYAPGAKVRTDVPWNRLSERERRWVVEGEGSWDDGKWYGTRRFFEWLEGRSYRMHVRVLLSKYRAYTECPACHGARLKPEALLWRLGTQRLSIQDVALLPIEGALEFFDALAASSAGLGEATELLLGEIRSRLRYLVEVGLGYLTLDRQSRTLSGGEVQRINLTTALGTSLVNTLFVLDEPSIGLHSRDIGRLIGVLHRLREAGNTLIVVEHDPEVIRAADYVLDMGPGAGERGGEIVFFGDQAELGRSSSLTAQYLSGTRRVVERGPNGSISLAHPHGASASRRIEVRGAAEHNLKGIDIELPLDRLVCVTGVSGSGKSTLVEEVLYYGIRMLKGRPVETPGKAAAILGHDLIDDIVLVNQSPIGKTTRSNPASYVGAFDAIRKLFAAEPLAKERGYTPGTFSFNGGNGRCPTCGGNGFEHIEMQFLSDVYIRCPDCNGRRYRSEVLEVKLVPPDGSAARSIADVLEMTVDDACRIFAEMPGVVTSLEPLREVGLGYLTLGQPVPTLSGGEAQRLKLAGYLARAKGGGGRGAPRGRSKGGAAAERILFLFDEPTTGLHFADIATLLAALRKLVEAGHSVVVIEHNLDVIAASDWVIDLGPEGGEAGGRLVCAGTPGEVMQVAESRTGVSLAAYLDSFAAAAEQAAAYVPQAGRDGHGAHGAIEIRHAREHNLKEIDIRIPRDSFTVITGVSGSGKSTIAFDILFAEGQRRYLESLNAYARQYVQPASRPDVDSVAGVPPTVAIEQRTSRGGRKSTVATMTEIYHFLRLLYAKLGTQYCPDCAVPIEPRSVESILAQIKQDYRGKAIEIRAPLVIARKGYYTDLAEWAASKGYTHLRVDGDLLPTASWPRLDRYREHTIELPVATLRVGKARDGELRSALEQALALAQGTARVGLADAAGREAALPGTVFSTRRACPSCGRSFEEPDPRLFSFNSKHGWCPACFGTGLRLPGFDEEQTGEEIWWNEWWEGEESICPRCQGKRLKAEALAIRFRGLDISELVGKSVSEAAAFFAKLRTAARESEIARDLVTEVRSRLAFLGEVGLPYLTLDRAAPTLSGGEAQRIRLASQLGSNLRGVCYILDEPTIGLHARDNDLLLGTLRKLKGKGNTVIVVEHDMETIRSADYVVDLGPGGGREGGRLVFAGPVDELAACEESATGRLLRAPLAHPFARQGEAAGAGPETRGDLTIRGITLHNLSGLDVALPLGRLVCVTGVSGSGKSTLVRNVIYENLKRKLASRRKRSAKGDRLAGCAEITGWESIDRVLEVDQTPIGKTPRSCPATYVGIWDEVRKLFARSPEARMRGYTPSRFSFNTAGGRCEECAGQGLKKIEMSFLPDVTVPCESCGGSRFVPETLAVRYRDRSVADILAMSIDEAVDFFAAHPKIEHTLKLLKEVGLGYLRLGQQSPSLSGGEAQRIKLVAELAKARPEAAMRGGRGTRQSSRAFYVLDEPTIGLHVADVERLISVLHRLVASGNSVVIIEHNLDVIAESDWIIDLGPEGGAKGGRVVVAGSPAEVASHPGGSHTARYLADHLAESRGGAKRRGNATLRRRGASDAAASGPAGSSAVRPRKGARDAGRAR